MSKRPISIPEFPEALAAIAEALRHPRLLNEEETKNFLERRQHAHIERHEYIATIRNGTVVYREHGRAGADLPVPPYYWKMLQRRRDFEAEASKVERALSARWLYRPNQRRAQELSKKILELAEKITTGSKHKQIARAAGCSVSTVKRALENRNGSQRK
ncbi:hypothetical protein [Rhodanobacter sp. L36]|uniref:hypothetical protein n=1 Tax=Rhodanobacter sp. L36 TaxID=1747221 RepID=UPI00131BD42C|nr:hypothetical protein [Rhodanobacter sp. L36]